MVEEDWDERDIAGVGVHDETALDEVTNMEATV
jgi:hypothetical protein